MRNDTFIKHTGTFLQREEYEEYISDSHFQEGIEELNVHSSDWQSEKVVRWYGRIQRVEGNQIELYIYDEFQAESPRIAIMNSAKFISLASVKEGDVEIAVGTKIIWTFQTLTRGEEIKKENWIELLKPRQITPLLDLEIQMEVNEILKRLNSCQNR